MRAESLAYIMDLAGCACGLQVAPNGRSLKLCNSDCSLHVAFARFCVGELAR